MSKNNTDIDITQQPGLAKINDLNTQSKSCTESEEVLLKQKELLDHGAVSVEKSVESSQYFADGPKEEDDKVSDLQELQQLKPKMQSQTSLIGNVSNIDSILEAKYVENQLFFQVESHLENEMNMIRSALSNAELCLIEKASRFGQVNCLNEIESLEVADLEMLTECSELIEIKETARLLLSMKERLERIIPIEPSKLHEAVDKAEELLVINSEQFGIYEHTGLLVQVDQNVAGIISIKEIDCHALMLLLSRIGIFGKYSLRDKTINVIDCPEKIANCLLSKQDRKVPKLMGITNSPTLRDDGSILDKPGYDDASGLLFIKGSEKFLHVPEFPTREDAMIALNCLLNVLKDFQFEDSPSRSVALCAILTGIVRRALPTAPIFGFSAPKMSSGKSLLADVVSLIVTGVRNSVIAQAENEAEEKKQLLALLREGRQIICYDNIEKQFESPSLCAALTSQMLSGRILGKSKMISVPTNALFLMTGNNLTFTGDISTRVLLCKLDPNTERPEERSFDVDLSKYIPEHRGELVAATLTILRAYRIVGMPAQNIKPFGRFEVWSNVVRSAIIWLDMADPCESRKDIENTDTVRLTLRAIFESWHARFGENSWKLKDVVYLIGPKDDLYDPLFDLAGERDGSINPRRLAKIFGRYKNRIENGYKLEMCPPVQGTNLWKVVKVK